MVEVSRPSGGRRFLRVATGELAATDRSRTGSECDPWLEFEHFYASQIGPLVAFSCALGASKEHAADLAQDVMLELWKNWAEVDYPKAYTRKIAIRNRSKRRHIAEEIVEVHHDIVDETARNPLEFSITRAEFRTVLEHLRRLPTRQRQVMALTFDGFAIVEIAEILGIREDAVRALLLLSTRKDSTNDRRGG